MSTSSVHITSSTFLNKSVLTALPLINGVMLIIAYASTPTAAKCGNKKYNSSQAVALGMSVLSMGLALLHAAGGVHGRDMIPYIGLLQAVNITSIVVLSMMIAYADSQRNPCISNREIDPCKKAKGWVVAGIGLCSIVSFLFLFVRLHASTSKFSKIGAFISTYSCQR